MCCAADLARCFADPASNSQFPRLDRSPKFTLRASRGLDLPIHGDGLAVRSYLYVEDVADAYITVLLKGKVRWAAPKRRRCCAAEAVRLRMHPQPAPC